MGKRQTPAIFKNAKAALTKYSPQILIASGITGMITTTVLAVKATPKALLLIEDEKQKKEVDKLAPLDTVKVAWKCYVPAGITCATSIACLVWANSVHSRRNAALAAAYKLSETALIEYRDKVVETIGEKKEQTVKDEIAKDRVKKKPVNKSEVIVTKRGETLCYDVSFDRYFKSDIEQLRKIENELNKRMLNEMYISLNEFYDEIGLPHIKEVGDTIGWNINKAMIDLHIGSCLSDDGTPCITVSHNNPPFYGYDRY